jgi:hypothetical protein
MKDVTETKDIKDIITRINKLQKKEKMHILNILKINDINFTKNENGYFFNLLTIDNHIVDKISKCLELIEKNSDIIKEIDKKRSELITYYKILIEERLQNTLTKRKLDYIETLIVKKISNINYNINRIYKIKRKKIEYEIDDSSMQADTLVKQFLKNIFKFKKDTAYSRIYSCIKTMQNKRSKSCVIDSNDTITEGDNNFENGGLDISIGDLEEDDELLEEDLENIEDIVEDDVLEYEDLGDIEEVEVKNKKKRIKEEYDDDTDDEIDKKIIIEEEEDKRKEEEEDKRKEEEDINYYKELLHLKGFSFDDNKQCMLLYQEYIY